MYLRNVPEVRRRTNLYSAGQTDNEKPSRIVSVGVGLSNSHANRLRQTVALIA
ncbi:hypothetical protein NNRS527_00986 [Nitrosospira sp. NRS527]|nr:hypothetical protein NNRS527_00986 [Nitrosospira sp. NRS527]